MSNETAHRIGAGIVLAIFLALAVAIFANTANDTQVMAKQSVSHGNVLAAPQAIENYGCGAYHAIPGIPGADGMVGPTLAHLSERSLLAGRLPNTADNLILWIQHPQMIQPGGDMPEMGVSDTDARNIASYLYSLP